MAKQQCTFYKSIIQAEGNMINTLAWLPVALRNGMGVGNVDKREYIFFNVYMSRHYNW